MILFTKPDVNLLTPDNGRLEFLSEDEAWEVENRLRWRKVKIHDYLAVVPPVIHVLLCEYQEKTRDVTLVLVLKACMCCDERPEPILDNPGAVYIDLYSVYRPSEPVWREDEDESVDALRTIHCMMSVWPPHTFRDFRYLDDSARVAASLQEYLAEFRRVVDFALADHEARRLKG